MPALKRKPGVWQTDAPPGWIGIVVYDRTCTLQMELKVTEEAFSEEIVEPLKEWARRNARIRVEP